LNKTNIYRNHKKSIEIPIPKTDVITWKTSKFLQRIPSLVGPVNLKNKFKRFMLVGIPVNKSVFWSYTVSLWRGQGKNPKSWGTEYKKLTSWGIKSKWTTIDVYANLNFKYNK